MKLSAAVSKYVKLKRRAGYSYASMEYQLHLFAQNLGDPLLQDVTVKDVSAFLVGRSASPLTWNRKYRLLKKFFDYCVARGYLEAAPLPKPRAPVRPTFVPYIYSREQVRALLMATAHTQKIRRCVVDPRTMRAFLLFLYASGTTTSEAMNLCVSDIDLQSRILSIRSKDKPQSRRIPFGEDLEAVLRDYLHWRQRLESKSKHVFLKNDGYPLITTTVTGIFQRLRRVAGISRPGGPENQPRMHDLRHSFAVHRITSWIRNEADLNRMLPALSAYMGFAGFTAVDKYFRMTPERLRKPLNKLSPAKHRSHWRNDRKLIIFLASL